VSTDRRTTLTLRFSTERRPLLDYFERLAEQLGDVSVNTLILDAMEDRINALEEITPMTSDSDGKEPLNGAAIPLRGGGSASGSGGPTPAIRPGCGYCGDEVVAQDDGRAFHLDGSPACRSITDAYPRKPVGWQPPAEEAKR
jgi:hypothetical protein